MKIRLLFLSSIYLLAGSYTNCLAQKKDNGFSLRGKIEGLQEGTTVYLRTANFLGHRDTLAKAKSKGDSFVLTGVIPEADLGRDFVLTVDESDARYKKIYGKEWTIYPENSRMQILCKLGETKAAKVLVSGSGIHDDFMNYNGFMDQKIFSYLNEFVQPAFREFENKLKKDSSSKAKAIREGASEFNNFMSQKKYACAQEWMKQNPQSLFAPSLLSMTFQNALSENEAIFNKFSDAVKKSYYGRLMLKEIEGKRRVVTGNNFPMINCKDVNGNLVPLEKIVAANELVLVDFWAFWCGPCRASFPRLKEIYHKYKEKGFDVYGISTDTIHKFWSQTLDYEKLPWHNVIADSLNMSRETFGITAIPASFLINKKGVILAQWVGESDDLEAVIKKNLER